MRNVPYVEVSKLIKGSRDQIYDLLKRVEEYPEFMADVESIRVLERDQHSSLSEWVTRLEGRRLRWVERETYHDDQYRMVYRMTEGDLKQFEGEWRLEETTEGTLVTLTCQFDLGIPMFAALLNPIARIKVKENVESMLEGLRQKVEGA
ncbi:MAG: cyclase [Bacillota bacterium]|nr:cyclase [Bacillota bacterium]REJ36621.1 MAG: cyclase [Bacillota bacterium]